MNEHSRPAKIKAYINPQMVNRNFLNAALNNFNNHMVQPNSSKILINPNFKRSSSSSAHNNKSIQPINHVHINPNFINQQQLAGSKVVLENNIVKSKAVIEPPSLNPIPTSYSINLHNNKTKINFNSKAAKEDGVRKLENSSKIVSDNVKNTLYSWHKANSHKTNAKNLGKKEPTKVLNESKPVKNHSPSQFKYVKGKRSSQTPVKTTLIARKLKPIYASRTKIINRRSTLILNKNKFNYLDKRKILLKKRLQLLHLKSYNASKLSQTAKVAASVRNKYKYTNKALIKNKLNLKSNNNKSLKYKIDKRKILPNAMKKPVYKNKYKLEKLFPNNSYRINSWWPRVWSNSSVHSWKRKVSNTTSCKNVKHYPNRTVVKIGGILYKSSQSKLTRTKGKRKTISPIKQEPKINKNKSLGTRNHVVYVRGEKFILDESGKSLKRLTEQGKPLNNKKTNIKRIDIGGVTYLPKSNNVLIRTNTHYARYVVNHAKHKSIALLSKLRKRNYMPCMIYSRLGKCARHEKGLCAYTHDKKNIALCKKFLKGECSNKSCLLSHDLVQEKMATCHFFINGCCTNETCPYLHVKVNSKSPICKDFIQGFCGLGQECVKRHENLCPEFDEKGKCSKGDKCLYPHKSKSRRKTKVNKTWDKSKASTTIKKEKTDQKVRKTKRLLIQDNEDFPQEKESESVATIEMTDQQEFIPKRIKLDNLPCFIPLDSSTKS